MDRNAPVGPYSGELNHAKTIHSRVPCIRPSQRGHKRPTRSWRSDVVASGSPAASGCEFPTLGRMCFSETNSRPSTQQAFMRILKVWRAMSVIAIVGCGSDSIGPSSGTPGGGGAPSIVSIGLSPSSPTVGLALTTQLSASTTDNKGVVVNQASAMWTSADTTVATIDQNGLVTARGGGTSVVTAAVGTVRGSTTVTVALQIGSYTLYDVDGFPPPIVVSEGSCGNAMFQCYIQTRIMSATVAVSTANAISIEDIYSDHMFLKGADTTFADTVRISGTYILTGRDLLLTRNTGGPSTQIVGAAEDSRIAFAMVDGSTQHVYSYQRR